MLAGSLTEFGLADVFSLLSATRKTGVLNIESPDANGRVWIAKGGLCYAVADVTRATLAARLLHTGQVTGNQAEEIIAAQSSGEAASIADTLSAFGLEVDHIRQLVRGQITDAVFELSQWTSGTFAFENTSDTSIPVAAPDEVLEDVAGRLDGWPQVRDATPDHDTVLCLVTCPANGDDQVSVDIAHWGILTLVDGTRSVGEIIDLAGSGRFAVSRILVDLLAAGLVEVGSGSGETPAEERRRILTVAEAMLLGASPARGGREAVAAAVHAETVFTAAEDIPTTVVPIDEVTDPSEDVEAVTDEPDDEDPQGEVEDEADATEETQTPVDEATRAAALAELGFVGGGRPPHPAGTDEQPEAVDEPAPLVRRRLARDRGADPGRGGRLVDGVHGA